MAYLFSSLEIWQKRVQLTDFPTQIMSSMRTLILAKEDLYLHAQQVYHLRTIRLNLDRRIVAIPFSLNWNQTLQDSISFQHVDAPPLPRKFMVIQDHFSIVHARTSLLWPNRICVQLLATWSRRGTTKFFKL